jgi:hypothetical protein
LPVKEAVMRPIVLAMLLLAACKGRDTPDGDGAAGRGPGSEEVAEGEASDEGSGRGRKKAGPITLTGLWEGGGGPQKSQLCMTGEGDKADFGLTVVAVGGAVCAGAGTATRSGLRLTLTMAGDRSCEVAARIEGTTIVLPATARESCSYYCAEGARLAGVRLARSGSTKADAMKAKDLAGDPLCG